MAHESAARRVARRAACGARSRIRRWVRWRADRRCALLVVGVLIVVPPCQRVRRRRSADGLSASTGTTSFDDPDTRHSIRLTLTVAPIARGR